MAAPTLPPYLIASPNDPHNAARTLAKICGVGSVRELQEFLKYSQLTIRQPLNLGEDGPSNLSCLFYACHFLNPETIIFLLDSGARCDVEFCTPVGLTPLMAIVVGSSPQNQEKAVACTKILVQAGVNVAQCPNFECRTLLTLAVLKGSEDLVTFLIEAGAKLNLRDDYGETPFNVAIESNMPSMMELLFRAGANPYMKNLDGERCKDLVEKYAPEMRLFLLSLLSEYFQTKYNGDWRLLEEMLAIVNYECQPSKNGKVIEKEEEPELTHSVEVEPTPEPIVQPKIYPWVIGGLGILALGSVATAKFIKKNVCIHEPPTVATAINNNGKCFGFALIFLAVAASFHHEPSPIISVPESLRSPLWKASPRLLFSASATNPSRRAFEALQSPILGMYENGTLKILSDIQDGLRYILQTKNDYTLAFHGTGTTGLLGILDNLIEPGDKILVGVNGYWGQLVANISAARFGAEVVKLEKPFGFRFTLSEIEAGLQRHSPKLLYLASGESSTGVYQPLEGVGEVCHRYDCITIADVVAKVGQQPIKMDANKIDAVYMNSQKGLGGIVGLAPVSFSSRAMEKIKNRTTLPKNYQTNLNEQAKAWFIERVELHLSYFHSISLPLLYMLREGLASIADEGLENVWARHADAHQYFLERAARLGLEHFVPNSGDRLAGTTFFNVPAGKDVYKICSYMLDTYDIEISPGLFVLLGKVIRIGLYGSNARRETAARIMSALEGALASPSTDL